MECLSRRAFYGVVGTALHLYLDDAAHAAGLHPHAADAGGVGNLQFGAVSFIKPGEQQGDSFGIVVVRPLAAGAKGQDGSGPEQQRQGVEIVEDSYNRAIFIAALNALMRKNGECDRTVHCKDKGPNECARKTREWVREHYGRPKITEIGYQPFLLDEFSREFEVRVLDLNPDNIGQIRYGVKVEDGETACEDALIWADIVFCTSSTLGNGTMVRYMDLGKPVYFYGTTGCCAAALFGLDRSCYGD